MGLGEMGLGELGLGEMGLGEMGQNQRIWASQSRWHPSLDFWRIFCIFCSLFNLLDIAGLQMILGDFRDDWRFMGAIGLHAKLSASNHALIDRKVKLVDLFKTMELLNNRYAFYMLGRGRAPPQTHPYRLTHFAL